MVMEVVAEELDVADGAGGDGGASKVAGEENEGDIAHVLGAVEALHIADLERRVTIRVEDLRCVLDVREATGIDKFLRRYEIEA